MSLVKFNKKRLPWINNGLTNWFDKDDFFAIKTNFPAINVQENSKKYEVELVVPGFDKKNIEVSLENDILHICAEKKQDAVEKNEEN